MQHRSGLRSIVLGRPGLLTGAAVLALTLAGGFGISALRAARPSLRWTWHPRSDRIVLTAVPGKGPLRGWVWDETTWGATGLPVSVDAREAETVRPGKVFHMQVQLRGPDAVREWVQLAVPPLPTFTVRDETTQNVELQSSQPLTAVLGLPADLGSWTPTDPTHIVLDRAAAAEALDLTVQAWSGERTTWKVAVPALPAVPVYWFGSPANGQVYITIDDGWYPSGRLLRLMRRRHVPITAFLIQQAVAEHLAYWQSFVEAGGVIEDHTVSHPMLTQLTYAAAEQQWAGPLLSYPQWLHIPQPAYGRPPYGALSPEVTAAAYAAGLKAIVMWDVVWTPGNGFQTWNGGPIQAGDIILLHWDPGVGKAVAHLLPLLKKKHLHAALLTAGLP